MLGFLSSDFDLTGVLTNCSENGIVTLGLRNDPICACDSNFVGVSCDTDIRACSYNPCINNSTCLEDSLSGNYTCECLPNFYGTRCENEIDLCANVTCSNHGTCQVSNNSTKCKCVSKYTGKKCELETSELKIIMAAIRSSGIIATIILLSLYITVALSDILGKFWCNKNKIRPHLRRKQRKKRKPRRRNKKGIF